MIPSQTTFPSLKTEGAMELCSLEDAFPNIDTGSVHKTLTGSGSGFPFVGGIDAKASKEERRAARKKAKKLKGPALAYSDSVVADLPTQPDPDPDRPAMKRMGYVPAVQEEKESFVSPVLPKASCLFSDPGTPTYFGKDVDDEEGFSNFSPVGSDNPNFMLQPDLKGFDLKGADKAAGILPEPNLDETWKPMSPAASYTAFLSEGGAKEAPGWSMSAEQKKVTAISDEPPARASKADQNGMLMSRINELVSRLETLEKKKSQDSQTEILMFVGTGVFLLVSFEMLTRR
jgi:hypothetical protein